MHTNIYRNNSTGSSPEKRIRPLESTAKPLFNGAHAIQRKSCACGGSCPRCQADKNAIQTKLAISKPTDSYEQEADRVADQIVDRNSNTEKAYSSNKVTVSTLQRHATSGTEKKSIPSSVHETLNDSGQALSPNIRSVMEPNFGQDFSNVRVHTGPKAAESSQDVNAKAYTVGTDIVFNQNQYAPGTQEGDRLIAHELTHVVQQSGDLNRSLLQRDELSDQEPAALDEEGDEDEGDETEGEEEGDEDNAEDGDTDVPDVVEYPEQPDLPDEIGHAPEPMPVNPEGEGLAPQEGVSSPSSGAQEMKGGGGKSKKIKSILVDQPTQEMTITFTDGSTKNHNISTGRGKCGTKDDPCKSQNSHNCTPNGTFTIVSQGNAKTTNSHGDAMAWFVGLKVAGRSGIGIHNSQPVSGIPKSHGCVRTGNAKQDGGIAEMINKGVTYGKTKVTIQGKAKTKPYPCPKKKAKKKGGGKGRNKK